MRRLHVPLGMLADKVSHVSRNGVICEDDGTLVSISFPLTRATDPLGDPVDVDHALNFLH